MTESEINKEIDRIESAWRKGYCVTTTTKEVLEAMNRRIEL